MPGTRQPVAANAAAVPGTHDPVKPLCILAVLAAPVGLIVNAGPVMVLIINEGCVIE